MLAVSVVFYANYDYYHDFFSAAARDRFIKVLLLHFLLLIVGMVFVFVRSQRKKWLQALFLLLLLADGLAADALVVRWTPPPPAAVRYSAPTIGPSPPDQHRGHGGAVAELPAGRRPRSRSC